MLASGLADGGFDDTSGVNAMTVADIVVLYDYNYWANTHLFKVLAHVSPTDFTRPVAGSYGSLRNTLVHVMSAEWGWLDRCGGPRRGDPLKAENFPDFTSVVDVWKKVEKDFRAFLGTLRDEDLQRVIEFTLGSGEPLAMRMGEMLHHSAVHATHHRGQIALLLRALGDAPGNFDILFYYAHKRGVSA